MLDLATCALQQWRCAVQLPGVQSYGCGKDPVSPKGFLKRAYSRRVPAFSGRSGSVSPKEFVAGLRKMKGRNMGIFMQVFKGAGRVPQISPICSPPSKVALLSLKRHPTIWK